MPDSCKVLREGGFVFTRFLGSGFIIDTPADLVEKVDFHANFNKDDKYSSILTPPEVKKDLLVTPVDDFLQFIRAQNYP